MSVLSNIYGVGRYWNDRNLLMTLPVKKGQVALEAGQDWAGRGRGGPGMMR